MDQNPQNAYQATQTLDKKTFNRNYWFTSLQIVEVVNPLQEDYPFMVEMRHFIVKKGANERLPGVIANVYLDLMGKILAQGDDKLAYMADPALMKVYFDKLIVNVESLVPEVNNTPAYLRDVPQTAIGQASDDTPPWQVMENARAVTPDNAPAINDPRIAALEASNAQQARLIATMAEKLGITGTPAGPVIEKATEVAPNPVVSTPGTNPEPTLEQKVEPTEKEFELKDDKFKMVIDKNGGRMFFKNGRRASEADYSRAASML